MNTLLVNLLVAALKNEKVQKAAGDFISDIVIQKLLPLIPIAAAVAAKSVASQIPGVSTIANVADIANDVRHTLNELIPDIDVGIPALDELLDFWRPKP